MNATAPIPKIGARSIAPTGARLIGVCMGVGAAFLVAGCWTGLDDPQALTLVLFLLSAGIAMFALSLVLQRRPATRPGVESSTRTSADQRPVPAPAPTPTPTPTPTPSGSDIGEPQRLAPKVAVMEPQDGTSTIAAAEILPASRPVEGAHDVAALMDVPLSDLLLAALCKDPIGARRIFARALESGAPPLAPLTPSTAGTPASSAMPPKRDVLVVATDPKTAAAP